MRRAQIAEWLLSLVGDPGRSASIVGDLVELGGEQRTVWFWSHVAGTMFFQLGRSLRDRPLRLLLLLAGGWLLAVLWILPFILAGAALPQLLFPGAHGNVMALRWSVVAAIYVIPWIVGRWTALCSPGRELAAAFALAATISPGVYLFSVWPIDPMSHLALRVGKIIFPFALLASATIVRRLALRADSPSQQLRSG